ncbi:glycosyltransferase family 2 protein [Pseudomonas sp. MAP12]|uniref:Glycosyltransferase family 2 protein n=1 Tax=Geopseudomonas aromaticivorans TaxID=2849492 RepID=A0ABS6MXI1_9GAMM|nr:glycosyltransferase family 2 protein [Pseudomonas aromaticivorans]MBV2132947.1 glycosyltransferase family 2 protein [Pseudomonas aromaticivorans]
MIDILLATHNGEKYINAQINSILNQTHKEWRLIIHDDGSSDNTVQIIKSYQARHPDKILFIDDGVLLGGAKKNFAHLMKISSSPYIMFCDQDDVWLPNKIQISHDEICALEDRHPGKAIIVHTDLEVVDQNLNTISNSMFEYQRLPKSIQTLDEMLTTNNITGCTSIINRLALNLSLPIPDEAVMHDWWIGCKTLQAGGIISLIPLSLIKYRQHSENAVGSKKITITFLLKKIFTPSKIVKSYKAAWLQARAINSQYTINKAIYLKSKITLRRAFYNVI